MPEFKYDLGISFLQEDEGIAREIFNKLSSTYSVFVYSHQQKELGGTDGEVKFRNVFLKECRFVAVLYRNNWGETQWTRVEALAIRDRTAQDGFDFFKLIMMGTSSSAPPWIPRSQIWIGFERYGIDQVAAIMDARLQELGAEPIVESPGVIAARLKRKHDFSNERRQARESQASVDLMRLKFETIGLHVKTKLIELKDHNPTLTITPKVDAREIKLGYHRRDCTVYFKNQASNVVGDKSGMVLFCGISPGIMALAGFESDRPQEISKEIFLFDYFPDRAWKWISKETGKVYTEETFADYVVVTFLKMLEEEYEE
jgi:hypothetical protein